MQGRTGGCAQSLLAFEMKIATFWVRTQNQTYVSPGSAF